MTALALAPSTVSCACGVEPLALLRHVLTELPQRPENAAIDDLLPFNFAEATAASSDQVPFPIRRPSVESAGVNVRENSAYIPSCRSVNSWSWARCYVNFLTAQSM
ncbi:transposase domain-containing protein [Mesorhizobium sp. M0578]|uniref:transposase domain-containing protein n=1 Tax=unclassified Mesorhizobium TaxID=325217 RepID=UPI003337FC5E